MDTKGMLDTIQEAEQLDTNTEAVTEWLASIDKRLKSLNNMIAFFVLLVVIAIIIQVLF